MASAAASLLNAQTFDGQGPMHRRPSIWYSFVFFAVLAVGLGAYAYCGWTHICKQGHGYHIVGEPIAVRIELAWILGFSTAIALAWLLPVPRRIVYTVVLPFLLGSRILRESDGGFLFLVEAPAGLLLAYLGAKNVIRSASRTAVEQAIAPDGPAAGTS